MTSDESITQLVRDNLYLVFGETNLEKRLAALSRLWVEDCLFVDPMGIFRTHGDISNLITSLQSENRGKVFMELGTSCGTQRQEPRVLT
jgi:hypothetical protein